MDFSLYLLLTSVGDRGPKGGELHDQTDPLADAPGEQPDTEFDLENHVEFKKLPSQLRALILASPLARSQMETLLKNGLTIELKSGLGYYQAQYNPDRNRIYLDADTINNHFDDNGEYTARIMISTIAHEMGHALAKLNSLFPQAS